MKNRQSITVRDNMKRYVARVVSKELWKQARISAVGQGKTMAEWINEAIKEKLGKENAT